MILKNLTPHTITIMKEDGTEVQFKSDWILRLEEERTNVWTINWINVLNIEYKKWYIEDKDWKRSLLKKKKDNVIYIVSAVACQWYKHRDDLYIVSDTYRDANWIIVWCKAISKNPYFSVEEEIKYYSGKEEIVAWLYEGWPDSEFNDMFLNGESKISIKTIKNNTIRQPRKII